MVQSINFKVHYKERYPKNLRNALIIACLCDSETSADFLVKKLKESFTDENTEYLSGYASAFQNEERIKK
jgi:porphobilinogen deaminase